MTVGIRYCGGCNPRYDRVQAVERLKTKYPGAAWENAAPGVRYDAVVVVNGCKTACTGTEDLILPPDRIQTIGGFEDIVPVANTLQAIEEAGREPARTLGREETGALLPHRKPMLFVTDARHLIPGREITARYVVAEDSEILAGHFPGNPVFPGSLMIEAMAQAADLLILSTDAYAGRTPYLMGVEDASFRRSVKPGDEMMIHAVIVREQREMNAVICNCAITVNEKTAATARIALVLR